MKKYVFRLCVSLLLCLLLAGCGGEKETPAPAPTEAPTAVPTATPAPTAVPTATPVPTAVPTATPAPTPDTSYTVAIKSNVAIYQGPGPDYGYSQTVGQDGVYTIVEETRDEYGSLWGYLKSGAGWVDLNAVRNGADETHPVFAAFADDALMAGGGYEYYIYSDTPYSVNVVIEAWRTVWDLEFAPMDNSGAQPVPGQTVYRVHRMDPGQRLVVKVDFPGDMSAYHIALTDGGVRRNFAVSISGRDGTPQCWESMP